MSVSAVVAKCPGYVNELGQIEDFNLRYAGVDSIEITATETHTGLPVSLFITSTGLIELVNKAAHLLNSYNAGMLKELGVL